VKGLVLLVAELLGAGCASSAHLVCFDRGAAGYAVGQASQIIQARCAAGQLPATECARLAEIEAAAAKQPLAPPPEPTVDAEALMKILIGAAKLAI
jgi:hypothetical protein